MGQRGRIRRAMRAKAMRGLSLPAPLPEMDQSADAGVASAVPHFNLAPLQTFDPKILVRDPADQVGAVVLALALWFNDMKDLLLGWHMIVEAVPDEESPTISATRGQAIGIRTHIYRLLGAMVHEL